MDPSLINPTFACFSGQGSAELRTLLGAVATFWVIAGIATLANLILLSLFALRRRPFAFHALLMLVYSTIAALMFTGALFEHAPIIALWSILVIPIIVIVHTVFLLKRFRKFGSTAARLFR